jgi:transcription elongation factor GreA
MSENVLDKKEEILLDIQEKLKEEKWTRAAIESYSVKNFIELDSHIRIAVSEGFRDDLKNLCKETLKHSQNSLVGLYIIGVLSLEESSIDDAHLPQIIKLFMDNRKHKIAEFLAEKILSYRENKFALKTLETIYEIQGQEDELFNVKKRLVLIDSKDASNAKFLGEYYEKDGDKELAMFYYRLAIERYIKSKSVKMVEDLWNRIIKLYPDDSKLIILIAKKISEVLGEEKVAGMVFEAVVKPAMKNENYQIALKILKVVLDFKPHDKTLRKAIEECYRAIYADHSQLEKYLKASAIGQSWKPHREAIRMFESHIAFDTGCYVSHKSWGVGMVKNMENDSVIIDFENKPGHEMSLKIALRALNVLDEDNITIWKHFKLDELKQLLFSEPLRIMEIIIKSYGGECASKDIKTTLVPEVLSEKEWTRWWVFAKKAMESSNTVVQSLSKRNVLEIRESEATIVEELVSKFKKTTNFENKIRLFIDFVDRQGEVNSEMASALVSYFTEIINASSESDERKVLSYAALRYGGYEGYGDDNIDSAIIFGIKKPIVLYEEMEIELKKPFLEILEKKLKDWDLRFSDFILNSTITKLHNYMVRRLAFAGKFDVLKNIFLTVLNAFQEKSELFVWFARLIETDDDGTLKENIGVKDSELVFRMLSLIDILNNEIQVKTDVGRNKKTITQIYDVLFKKNLLDTFLDNSDETTWRSVHSIIIALNTLEKEIKEEYLGKIVEKYPNMKKEIVKPETIKIRHPFLVTRKSFEKKKADLHHMMNVEIPQNSMAIGEAMEKGDLRENAEYKAALEKQDQLKAAASKLESELNQAKILDKNMVDTDIVDVGTRVKLKDQDGNMEEYQILGQWEVDYEHGIISYHSPLGRALLDKHVGDTCDFEFSGTMKNYEVLDITIADFD